MRLNLRVVTPPSNEPMTLSEARDHLQIADDDTHMDDWITRAIKRAREAAEAFTNRCLTDAEYEYRIDRFYCAAIPLPLGDIGTVSEIDYVDSNGDSQVLGLDVYVFDDNPDAPTVRRAFGKCWPATRCEANAVTITFQGRYDEGDSPPVTPAEEIKGAMAMLIAHWDQNREAINVGNIIAELPLGVQYMLQPYRLSMGV